MTTDTSALRVESQALVAFGVERYEDSVSYSAVRRYLGDVGSIPASAWGTLPISGQLQRDWSTALANRISEAATIEDEMVRMADGIMQIATDYEGTDLEVATSFDLVNRDLMPYLPLGHRYADSVRTRPGGVGILSQPTYHHLPGDQPTAVIPGGNDKLSATRNERLPTTRVVEEPITLGSSDGNDLTISGGRTTYYENGENDHLDRFIQEHRSILLQLEALLTQLGTGHRLPLSDLMLHAWRSSPGIIRNRADLVHSAANTYSELWAEMDGELKRLKLYWEGSAATAFSQYAEMATGYLTQIEAQARWLAEEGKKAASLLEGLRNAYASTGYERIGSLIQALNDYRGRVAGMFSACTSPEKALVDAVGVFIDALSESEQRYVQALADLIKIDEQQRKERPDLGTRGHDATPFPRVEVGANAWTGRGQWAPKAGRPAI